MPSSSVRSAEQAPGNMNHAQVNTSGVAAPSLFGGALGGATSSAGVVGFGGNPPPPGAAQRSPVFAYGGGDLRTPGGLGPSPITTSASLQQQLLGSAASPAIPRRGGLGLGGGLSGLRAAGSFGRNSLGMRLSSGNNFAMGIANGMNNRISGVRELEVFHQAEGSEDADDHLLTAFAPGGDMIDVDHTANNTTSNNGTRSSLAINQLQFQLHAEDLVDIPSSAGGPRSQMMPLSPPPKRSPMAPPAVEQIGGSSSSTAGPSDILAGGRHFHSSADNAPPKLPTFGLGLAGSNTTGDSINQNHVRNGHAHQGSSRDPIQDATREASRGNRGGGDFSGGGGGSGSSEHSPGESDEPRGGSKDEPMLQRLRQRIQTAFRAHLYQTGAFLADKVLAISNDTDDLFTLAECLYQNREYARVIFLLTQQYPAQLRDEERLKLLVVQSYLCAREFDEALRFLDESCLPSGVGLARFEEGELRAVFAYLKGRVFEHFENRDSAVNCYKLAVHYDPYLHEAVEKLLSTSMLSRAEEQSLIERMAIDDEDAWLRTLYAARSSATAGDDGNFSADASSSTGLKNRLSLQPLEDCKRMYPLAELPQGLRDNAFVLGAIAERYYARGDYTASYLVSKKILERDPYELDALGSHIASLVLLENKTLVFCIAHQLLKAYPNHGISWYASGCYYYMARRYETARKFFSKATLLEHNFAPAWVAYGHAFAFQEESDQALTAYRTASRLFPGSHLPWLFLGMEYTRTSNLTLAEQSLHMGRSIAPNDPNLYNELGVCAFEKGEFENAVGFFDKAHRLKEDDDAFLENLGHAYLKCNEHSLALVVFEKALSASDGASATAHCAVAFVRHLSGDLDSAIENYHRALSLQSDDPFAQEMLNYAVQEAAGMEVE
ncbi:unnamed protein product [Amoebophrya sp. A25]|nr:unnamed protein product [Amoebophrya sp. A25]|eukprot:GSA25T00024309001.1